ncbi:signal peptidase I [Streptomyces rugosispiralis]|uniref:Signal peptidase I n=1 Tax=Streptomyces rugosispiralis TaxID=2967341 RepID=A0ABT1UXT1_9ACTN|nr:signal peptidase I [Streptomyces rugosispiralis]MCQ8189389.1 signal peptidase I [Streptomyces rugosispiralis]
MNTEGQLAERDSSPGSEKEHEGRSRSSYASARAGEPPSTGRLPHGPIRAWLTGGGRRRRAALLATGCAALVLLVSGFVLQPFLIPSGSMEGTLRPGDRVLVNKLAYRFGDDPRRGDVVVFDGAGSFGEEEPSRNPVTGLLRKAAATVGLAEPAESDYVKRVVGIGGDRVTCCDKRGRIEVNGQPVDEHYLHPGDSPSRVRFDIVVPEGRLWVMGDHRDASRDSRDHLGAPGGGTVPVDKVIGRAQWIGWPLGRWSGVPRTDAFTDVPAAPGRIPSAASGGAHG